MSWWDDLWLNEGFASYVEYKGVDEQHPQWDTCNRNHISRYASKLAFPTVCDFLFQLDGTPLHRSLDVREFLNSRLHRWIGRTRPWPMRSSKLSVSSCEGI
ncbi:hypothetical protein NPIL_367861 [Nephila pilipes]|uniref:Peptidase M1 membrane alanine aminopeptidase domain-containing protein n=1 Tax=Nephila pilipes TaxID=299642 RepID=A0A8X6QKW6_NEPPI|nr:hypothetical protein NPIL_363031 [Nephila pilipes]GFU32362.1 hypothetical protein NPIL_367861 [Nephila pilipes]